MGQVNYSNIFSMSRDNVVALITSANVPDPVTSSAEFRKWIYSRDPDVKGSDFTGYPLLIVHPSDVDQEDKGSCDGKSKFVTWDIEIEIVTSDRAWGNNNGKGLTHMDTISNNVMKTFSNITNRKSLSANGMAFSKPTSSSAVPEVIQNELCYRRSIMLPFRSRIQVSA